MAGLNYVTFNQDHSLLAVATTRGLRTYTTDPFELTITATDDDIAIVEPLFSTSLIALITTPRLLRIINTKRNSTICELTFHGMVIAVKMNRKRMMIMLEEVVFIYDLSDMRLLHQQLTPLNAAGICALSPNSEHNYLALPHHQNIQSAPQAASQPAHVPKPGVPEAISGDVLLYDLTKMEEITVIQAHQAPLSCIAISNDGTLMATASEKGTVIRVFALPSGKKLYQFRRGSMPARIYCMTFNATSTLLCVSSATETIHLFKLAPPNSNSATQQTAPPHPTSPPDSPISTTHPEPSPPSPTLTSTRQTPQPRNPGFMSFVRRTSQNVSTGLVTRAAGYLPSSVTEMWEPQRDFAWMKLPRSTNASGAPVRSVVALAAASPHVLVATGDGWFYVYAVDLQKGGEGRLVKRVEFGDDLGT
ncbi:hypothetical protein LTR62_000979 [Meristemomyces frigidus]|uniref:Autophagy-related protein 18 n=1 Tax=Meristemomyces frigidus TaxID=1508187 RepID=A0AAN7T9R0_9PEZI|nr:hypothetical protein LTR62_000979 [Meristemomyces frigidus]